MTVKVIEAKQAPDAKSRWHVTLACGHQGWMTAHKRPESVPNCMTCGLLRATRVKKRKTTIGDNK